VRKATTGVPKAFTSPDCKYWKTGAKSVCVRWYIPTVININARNQFIFPKLSAYWKEGALARHHNAIQQRLMCISSKWSPRFLSRVIARMKRSIDQLLGQESASMLSHREREIALLIAQGLSNKDIARELRLSYGTVKIHVHRILRKLGAKSRYSLIARSRPRSVAV
jgi:DNA-binding NarL/FixJ family response regulator